MTLKAEQHDGAIIGGQVMNVFGMLVTILRYILFPFLACVALKQYGRINQNIESMLFLCFTFIVLSFGVALFYRFNNYFYIFAIIVMSEVMFAKKIYLSKRIYIKVGSFSNWSLIAFLVLSIQIKNAYMPTVPNTHMKEYMRYFPYSSVINKKKDYKREQIFQYYNAF